MINTRENIKVAANNIKDIHENNNRRANTKKNKNNDHDRISSNVSRKKLLIMLLSHYLISFISTMKSSMSDSDVCLMPKIICFRATARSPFFCWRKCKEFEKRNG